MTTATDDPYHIPPCCERTKAAVLPPPPQPASPTRVTTSAPLMPPPHLRCTGCGVETVAMCHCGVAYVPAGERARRALADHPELSDRALAEVAGVDHKTVAAARKATGEHSPVKRVGKDNKPRKLPKPAPRPESTEDDIEPAHYRSSLFIRADQAIRFAVYSGPVDKEILEAIRAVASAWMKLADESEARS